jgi:hypothetical protein
MTSTQPIIAALKRSSRSLPTLLVKSVLIAWLMASLLFAHSCHGNEDTELFAAPELIAAQK